MPKLFTYIYVYTANSLTYCYKDHFVSIIASSDTEARKKLNLHPLIFISQKPIRGFKHD